MATCRTAYHRHHEGWGPVSTLREFDLTPCFEEGIVLSTLLVALLVLSIFRLWGIRSEALGHIHILTTRSASVLNAKLVRSIVMLSVSMTGVSPDEPLPSVQIPTNTDLARGRVLPQFVKPRLRRVRPYPRPCPPVPHP